MIKPVKNCDLYGLEFYNHLPSDFPNKIQNLIDELGNGKIFISEATYPVYGGNTDGYLNQHSYEAQAKYFDELIQYCEAINLPGYFINTMFDYRGDYASLTSGYNAETTYNIGILGEDRRTDRLSYKVIFSRLHNAEKVTIPIGIKKDDAPMILNIFGIILALAMGIMVNSGRKFREDSSRALLRPYNFYADVRDQRIISGYHSVFLSLIISAVSGLLLTNLLFYFKDSIMVERILLSFGSPSLIKLFSYLAWNPVSSLLWLTIASGVILLILTIVIKTASLFVKNHVYLSSVFFTVTWSYLPLVLLIPVGIVLYRLLSAEVANVYIYISLIVFTIWIFYRLIKGIYVIFDVNPGSVYFYSILAVILLSGFILFYYEINNSVIQYLRLVFSQYNVIH
jgi:beta-galactosidase